MSTIDNLAASVNQMGNRIATHKNAPNSKESTSEGGKRVTTSDAAKTSHTDTVEISSQRSSSVETAPAELGNEAEAAALLADIKRQLKEEEQQNLEQLHNLSSEVMVAVMS